MQQKFEQLHQHPDCTLFLHELLFIIEERMIVTVSETTNRITSAELHSLISQMCRKMEVDSAYYQRPCKMPRTAKKFDPVYAVFQSNRVERIQDRIQDLAVHEGPTQRTKSIQQLIDMEKE